MNDTVAVGMIGRRAPGKNIGAVVRAPRMEWPDQVKKALVQRSDLYP
ncbi:hypothetical protein [Noviherbaspirillum saxi]|nr:hypothetical protein [Noviherbaspirillum saxi]